MTEKYNLLQLARLEYKKKNRRLKIICDYDECLQPVNPFFFYKLAKEKGWKLPKETFKEWFDYYWENSRVEYRKNKEGRNIPYTIYVGIEKIEEIRNKDPDWWSRKGVFNEVVRKPAYKIMEDLNFYEEAPLLLFAEELLQCLKEELISELIIVSASNGIRKTTKFDKTFGLFPNVKLSIHKTNKQYQQNLEKKRHRWEWIKEDHPDFDIFIDDNPWVMKEVEKIFSNQPEKVLVMPDYKCKHHHVEKIISKKPEKEYAVPDCINVYLIKNAVSDLKDENFTQAAREYKVKKEQEKLASRASSPTSVERERERERALMKTTGSLFSFYKWSSI